MKPVRPLPAAARVGLEQFRAANPDADWEAFREHDGGVPYRELREALCDAQRRLCAYCEIDLRRPTSALRVQVEHFLEKSRSAELGQNLHLDPDNLLAACTGGGRSELGKPHYAPPTPDNLSCGQSKERVGKDAQVLDPRLLSLLPGLCIVDDTGAIRADADACQAVKVDVALVEETIRVFGLQCRRLRKAREDLWLDLLVKTEDLLDDVDALTRLAADYLLPNGAGDLLPFWTTIRCFFADVAEPIVEAAAERDDLP